MDRKEEKLDNNWDTQVAVVDVKSDATKDNKNYIHYIWQETT